MTSGNRPVTVRSGQLPHPPEDGDIHGHKLSRLHARFPRSSGP